jgi:hypothetical protein
MLNELCLLSTVKYDTNNAVVDFSTELPGALGFGLLMEIFFSFVDIFLRYEIRICRVAHSSSGEGTNQAGLEFAEPTATFSADFVPPEDWFPCRRDGPLS